MRPGTGRLRRSDRLRRRREFERVSREGWRSASRGFVILVAPGQRDAASSDGRRGDRPGVPGKPRLGITASKRVGNAVTRNRMKRAVREWFRHHHDDIEQNVDMVVIVRREATMLERDAMKEELSSLARRARRRDGAARRSR